MNKPRFLKKGDVILVVAVAVALLLFWGVSRFLYPPAENGVAEITVNGKPHGTYRLDKEVSLKTAGITGLKSKTARCGLLMPIAPTGCVSDKEQSAIREKQSCVCRMG